MSTFVLTAPGPLPDATDPRHAPIRDFIKMMQNETGVPEQWNARSAKALATWLKSNPLVTVEQAQEFIRNKFASEEPLGEPPFDWLPRLSRYCEGPLDRFRRVWRPDFRVGYEGIRH